ncbi:MAG: hypothetical protein U5R46_05755 [Gammaproteobacteria bacterium]|nr:hypothetical protein [Gammaproteobacteria bacterium]
MLLAIAAFTAAAAVLCLLTGSGDVELGTLWHGAAPESLNLTQAVTQRYLHPAAWTHGILPVLLMPAAGVFMVTSAIAMVLFVAITMWKHGKTK